MLVLTFIHLIFYLPFFFCFFLGLEMFVQVTIQILVLLLSRTNTPTTGGLETIFDSGRNFDATAVLVFSITWSLFSSIKTHTNLTILEKGFCPTTSKIVVFCWSTFATLRRILALVTLFIPSMGLFNLLHHLQWDQIPFKARQEYAKRFTISPDDRISLYGFNETIYWSGLDRWDYTNTGHKQPTPPTYPTYTLLSLQNTFFAMILLSIIQFIAIFSVKMWTSIDFREERHRTNKGIHVLENLNFASPFRDWDDGNHTVQEYKERARAVRKEMFGTWTINFISSITMLVPLWITGFI